MAICCIHGKLRVPVSRESTSEQWRSRVLSSRLSCNAYGSRERGTTTSGNAGRKRNTTRRTGSFGDDRNRRRESLAANEQFRRRYDSRNVDEGYDSDDKYFIPQDGGDETDDSEFSEYTDEEGVVEEEDVIDEKNSQEESKRSSGIASARRLLERLRTRKKDDTEISDVGSPVITIRKRTEARLRPQREPSYCSSKENVVEEESRGYRKQLQTKALERKSSQVSSNNEDSLVEGTPTFSFDSKHKLNLCEPAKGDYREPAKGNYREPAEGNYREPAKGNYREPAKRNYRGPRDEEELKLQDAFYSRKSFSKLGASEEIIEALKSLGVNRPSEIQALSFNKVLRGESCIIAEQTGSGKTLAYLAPLVQRLREEEEKGDFSTSKNPRVLVLVPTSELAIQVLNVCRALSKTCPLKSMVATGGFRWKTQVENLESGPDIVVATPGRFLHHLDEETIQLKKLKCIVLDEVDILFEEEEFLEAMRKIGSMVSYQAQYIHVTATLPTDVHDKILQKHPDSTPVLGPSLHLTAPGLDEVLVDCSGGDEKTPETAFENKKSELLKLIQEQPVSKTIIFCNKIETCRKVENVLNRFDRTGKKLSILPYHAALTQETRLKNMQSFLNQPDLPTFLVCTDRASRGLDSLGVEHVMLFDFPRDPSEYIRRVGRTARAGGAGKVFVFVVGKQVSLARKILTRNEKRHPVHSVPGTA